MSNCETFLTILQPSRPSMIAPNLKELGTRLRALDRAGLVSRVKFFANHMHVDTADGERHALRTPNSLVEFVERLELNLPPASPPSTKKAASVAASTSPPASPPSTKKAAPVAASTPTPPRGNPALPTNLPDKVTLYTLGGMGVTTTYARDVEVSAGKYAQYPYKLRISFVQKRRRKRQVSSHDTLIVRGWDNPEFDNWVEGPSSPGIVAQKMRYAMFDPQWKADLRKWAASENLDVVADLLDWDPHRPPGGEEFDEVPPEITAAYLRGFTRRLGKLGIEYVNRAIGRLEKKGGPGSIASVAIEELRRVAQTFAYMRDSNIESGDRSFSTNPLHFGGRERHGTSDELQIKIGWSGNGTTSLGGLKVQFSNNSGILSSHQHRDPRLERVFTIREALEAGADDMQDYAQEALKNAIYRIEDELGPAKAETTPSSSSPSSSPDDAMKAALEALTAPPTAAELAAMKEHLEG